MKLTFVGDIFPAELKFTAGFGIKSKFEKGCGELWEDSIKKTCLDSDYIIGNLESPLIEESIKCKNSFYGVPSFATFLKGAGLYILNVANNHILEHGKIGYERTIDVLKDAGLGVIGNRCEPYYILKDNIKIGIAGFNSVDLDYFENDNCFSILTIENCIQTIRMMEENSVDVKILCFHWGNEYIHKPALWQRELAYKLIDEGVDVIIGHHSHVIQPYEQYKDKHIFYSLGNFCFDNHYQSRQFSRGMGVVVNVDNNKRVEIVNIFGVNLIGDNLLKRTPQNKFEKYFEKIQNDYNKVKQLQTYDKIYSSELRRNHLIERLLMKLSWLPLWLSLNMKNRKLFLRNIQRMYISK